VTWRWSHTRHHTDTIIVGRDPEIVFMRPPDLLRVFLNFFGLVDAWHAMKAMVTNTFGVMSEEEKTYVPESEQPRAIRIARIWFAIYAATIALALYTGSILPLMLVGLPRLYGAWHHVMTGLLQHGGLAENVIDHRLNSRTVYMNPVSRFIYWNMNYHVEHHMFPMVPYHALPKLHALIKDDLPAPISPYGVTKLSAEVLFEFMNGATGARAERASTHLDGMRQVENPPAIYRMEHVRSATSRQPRNSMPG
jgi:fatty acid desaturase